CLLGVELDDVGGVAVSRAMVLAHVGRDARDGREVALRGGGAVDRGEEVADGVEHQHEAVAGVTDVRAVLRGRDARWVGELARARAGNARLAVGGADLAVGLAVGHAPPPGGDEIAVGVEFLYARVSAVGDVHGAARGRDRHSDRGLELPGTGALAAERPERNEDGVRRRNAERERRGRAHRDATTSDTSAKLAFHRTSCACPPSHYVRNTKWSHRDPPSSVARGVVALVSRRFANPPAD